MLDDDTLFRYTNYSDMGLSIDTFAERMIELMPEMHLLMMRRTRHAVARGDLSLPQFWALYHLHKQAPCPVHSLAEHLNLSFSTASELIDRLVNAKYIARERSREDRRVVHLKLTAKGRRTVEKIFDEQRESIKEIFRPFNAEERETYTRLMARTLEDQ